MEQVFEIFIKDNIVDEHSDYIRSLGIDGLIELTKTGVEAFMPMDKHLRDVLTLESFLLELYGLKLMIKYCGYSE